VVSDLPDRQQRRLLHHHGHRQPAVADRADAVLLEHTGKEGEKFTAGKLGEYTIGAEGVVVLGPPTVFDASNIDQFNF
jgi:hypothetical protein